LNQNCRGMYRTSPVVVAAVFTAVKEGMLPTMWA